MPSMSVRWRNAAFIMAALGFVAPLVRGTAPLEYAVLNAATWFVIVYAVFLAVVALRRAARAVRR